jgi:UPF0716 family protein affecting phage T7 exclusion
MLRSKLGCLAGFAVLIVMTLEVFVFIKLAGLVDDYLGLAILAAAMSYAGVRLAMYHGSRLGLDLMSGNIGNRMVALIGAVLLAIPGFAHGIIGILLQIPILQRLLAKPAAALAMSMIRNTMGKMSGSAMGAGNPFGAFGGFQLKGGPKIPPGPVKTYDTTAEKVDDRK